MAFTFGAKRVVFRRDVEFTEGVEEGRLEGKEMKGNIVRAFRGLRNIRLWQSFATRTLPTFGIPTIPIPTLLVDRPSKGIRPSSLDSPFFLGGI